MLNRCEFIGNLGATPEMRQTQDGKKIANFTIAVNEKWKDKDGQKQERTEWVPIVAFEPLAKVVESYLNKGSKVYAAGKMQTRKWTGNDGQEKYTTEVILNDLEMLDTKGNAPNQESPQNPPSSMAPTLNDEIPF